MGWEGRRTDTQQMDTTSAHQWVTSGGKWRSSRLEDPTSLWPRPPSHVHHLRALAIPCLGDKSEKLCAQSQRMQDRWRGGWREVRREKRKKEARGASEVKEMLAYKVVLAAI